MAADHLGIQGTRESEFMVSTYYSEMYHFQWQNVEGWVKVITMKMQDIEIYFFLYTMFVTRTKHDHLYKLYPPINLPVMLNWYSQFLISIRTLDYLIR